MEEEIKRLWKKCQYKVRDVIIEDMVNDERMRARSTVYARQRYIYDMTFEEGEAEAALEIIKKRLDQQEEFFKTLTKSV
ncbi:MAG: hypothetical protein AAGF96_06115 [Bacteroidota bacterium]